MTNLVEAVSEFATATEEKITDIAARYQQLAGAVRELETQDVRVERYTKAEREHREVFHEYLRNPKASGQKRLTEFVRDTKDVTLGTPSGGGFALPKIVQDRIESFARTLNPWLDPQILGATDVESSDYREPLGISDVAASRSTETGTRSNTGTTTFRERQPAWGEYFCYSIMSDWARSDIRFMETFMVADCGDQIAALTAADIWNGTGSGNQMHGLIATAPSTVHDVGSPLRAAGVLQYKPISGALSPQRILLSDIELMLELFNEKYLLDPSFAFMMRPTTWRAVCAAGRSQSVLGVVDAAFLMPRNPTLYGFSVRLTSAVSAIAANAFPIVAGAWKRAYSFVTRGPMGITVDDNITTPSLVKFWIRRRFGGTVRNNNAAKLLRFATS